MASAALNLPPPKHDQSYVEISALEAGFIELRDKLLVAGADENDVHVAPSLAFLLTHVQTGKHLVFDLGISPDRNSAAYTPSIKMALANSNISIPKDVITSLKAGGLEPEDITEIILSHIDFDHVGDPAKFQKARFVAGEGARALLKAGYPGDPNGIYHSQLLPEDRTEFLDTRGANWKPIGPFERALDYFGDGSLYLVDAPGHLPGQLNVLARTSADGAWIYLAGDSAHDWRIVHGQADIAVLKVPFYGTTCMHASPEHARETINKIASLLTLPRVRVVLAHDNKFYAENRGGTVFWPGKIPSL